MDTRSKIAFWCYFAATAGPAAWAVMFLFRGEFMPYHADAVGMPWSAVPTGLQVLLLGLMKLAGAAQLTSLVGVFVLLLLPFRRGASWARWAVPLLGLLHYAGVINAMAYVTQRSSATPPWIPTLAGLALFVVGAVLSLPGQSKTSEKAPAATAPSR
jgi:hypothetical protein